MYLFRHNIDARSHFIISKSTYPVCIVVESKGLDPGKFQDFSGQFCAFSGSWLYL